MIDRLEDPGSPYRIIISVGMLKEGWDVKNVYVIASLRASVSDILTEQSLGRGLRSRRRRGHDGLIPGPSCEGTGELVKNPLRRCLAGLAGLALIGAITHVMPLWRAASGSVRTRSSWTSAICAKLVQIFCPVTTRWSPSTTARV